MGVDGVLLRGFDMGLGLASAGLVKRPLIR